ncbi:serine/threonine-protein kinase [Nostoc sp. 'Lobaria pulmonaria (5183) cyanobiont']|uniref:serine/threonine-protein kinase n=1 Tax=Nostoc sp. 'Lobaria pulmonaria (5183) cyanobiont' TaxID=1618022 RepID=UPI000CF317D5|nr:serine/threonine-protein kinase [Nostoc sp. 'Lobaria pulmonaria (5183) cyanobiont']AVH72279.1 serine/threonine protein kinase [Nostoc sp. 'Lobaria pulmonaria (5183) cyanobiont']
MKSPPSSNSWNGRFVGDNQRYRLDRRLGGGGMGEVFLATDTRVGQQVALKLLKDTLVASLEMRKRFEREVAVCAALQSDHIVKISDCGVTPEGFPFYVMEYLRGQTLGQLLLRQKRLSVERTVKIMAQVCKGLQLAHQGVTLQRDGGKTTEHIQVVHRDLKPDNIFLMPTDLGEWVKVLDFGVAKIRGESSENSNITNITSTFIGTFRYAPPEQIQSDRNLDARGDIYSLGIILYEMLSAADPFGISIKGSYISEASWVLAHAYELPKPLRSQPECENLPIQLEAVVMKCLQKNPANRFATVEELNQALQAAAKFATESSVSGEITGRSQPFSNQGSNHETVPRQSNDDTILRPPSAFNQGSNHETVPRQSNDDTILRPSASNQGSNHETVPRQSNDDTIVRPPSASNQGSNHETVPRPFNPIKQNQSEQTVPPIQAGQTEGSNHETVPRPFNPVEQNQQSPVNNRNASKPDVTLYQPRPGSNQGGQQIPPDKTLFQPRLGSNQCGQQVPPDKTLFQPRPGSNQNRPPVPPDKTLFQPRPASNQSRPPVQPDVTLYQPRPASNQSRPQARTDDTIYQPKLSEQLTTRINPNFLRILGVVLAIGLTLAVVTYIYTQSQSRKQPNTQQNLPNSDQRI